MTLIGWLGTDTTIDWIAPRDHERGTRGELPDQGAPGAGRMLVWGGGYNWDAATGALYDFIPDQWDVVAPMPSAPTTPNPSASRTAVWTGTELIAWDIAAGVGGRYKP